MRIKYPGRGVPANTAYGRRGCGYQPLLENTGRAGAGFGGFKKHRLEVFDAADQMIAGFPKGPNDAHPILSASIFQPVHRPGRAGVVIPQENLLLLDIREKWFQPYLQGRGTACAL